MFFSHDAIKKLTKSEREVVSDVFIFDPSAKTEIYCLVVIKGQRELPNARSSDKRISAIPQNYKTMLDQQTAGFGSKNPSGEKEFFFSLSVMSFSEIEFIELPYCVSSQIETLDQQITFGDVGGNFLDADFLRNPTFRLRVLRPMQYSIRVELDRSAYVMLYLVKDSNSNQAKESEDCLSLPFQNFLEASNPKFYFQGISSLDLDLEEGNYFLIASIQSISKKIMETP